MPGIGLVDFAVSGRHGRARASAIVGAAAVCIFSLPDEEVISGYGGHASAVSPGT